MSLEIARFRLVKRSERMSRKHLFVLFVCAQNL
jgi:hypothetical protein